MTHSRLLVGIVCNQKIIAEQLSQLWEPIVDRSKKLLDHAITYSVSIALDTNV